MCEVCGNIRCICDMSDDPVDLTKEEWQELYANNPDLMEYDTDY